jgi:hypothetical protein
LPTLLTDRNRWAVGRLRRSAYGEVTELLVQNLEPVERLPLGRQYAPLADWVVLASPTRQDARDPQAWIERLQPRPAQLLAVALLAFGQDHRAWNGWVIQGDHVRPLDGLRVVGAWMLRIARDDLPEFDAKGTAALRRWSRTRGALGEHVWRKVTQSHVAIFGASRTGSMLAFQMAALGCRRLVLVDPDTLEEHNLDAMAGVTEADVGKTKVEALASRLVQFRSDLTVQGLTCSVTDPQVVDRIRSVDLLVTCVDSDTPRLAAALLANRLLKVHLDIATGVTSTEVESQPLIAGDVRLLLPSGLGCVCCVGGLSNEEEARYELLAPPGALRRTRPRAWHEERAGSLITINTMSVAVGVQLWLDLLAGHLRSSHWSRLRWRAGQGLEIHKGAVEAGEDCRICQDGTLGH